MRPLKLLIFVLVTGLAFPAQARLLDSADSTRSQSSKNEKSEPSSATSSSGSGWGVMWAQFQTAAKNKMKSWKAQVDQKLAELRKTDRDVVQDSSRAPASEESAVNGEVATAPVFTPVETPELKEMSQIVEQTKKEVQSKEAIEVVSQGRAGTSELPKTKGGVPTFSLSRTETKTGKDGKKKKIKISVDKIPRLDIGLEKSISKNDFIPTDIKVSSKIKQKLTPLDSPKIYSQSEIEKLKAKKWPVVAKAQPPKRADFELGQIVTQAKIDAVSLAMTETRPLEALKPFKEFTKNEMDMLAAVILYEKGNKCHLASGLLVDLANNKFYAEESNFYLGVCAHQMGFHSEAVSRLLRVLEIENPNFTAEAITNLVEDLPREYDHRVAPALKALKNKKYIEDKARDNVNYVLARAAHARGQYGEAASYSEKISEKSSRYAEARYLYGVALYGLKKTKEAQQALTALREWMNKKGKRDKNLEALIAVNVARMHFTQGRYQSANEEYLKVPKDHPLWVQALIEQGWTQLNIDDPEGAIGNMYSLHSPYFKAVFMPESWVVRTIGYIDICQYGDAYKTLTRLEQLHSGWQTSINQYLKANKSPSAYYSTVKNYLRGKSDRDVDGLPYQVIREIARQRGFLNSQGAINVLEDEIGQYNFIYGMVKKDQSDVAQRLAKTHARLTKIRADLAKVKTTPELIKHINEWNGHRRLEEQLMRSYEFQKQLFESARKGYVKMKQQALARIDKDKGQHRHSAGRALMSHLKDISGRIAQIVEGNEFLRYEIFSGSGENIRFQVSGGKVGETKRIPANVKPQKILNWEFDGEYWEDEIGSYRSTLKNNCPKNARTALRVNTEQKKTANNN